MSKDQLTPAQPGNDPVLNMVVEHASGLSDSDSFQSRIYQAISVQHPVVIDYLKSLRREKPDATPAQILKMLEKRYVTTVTLTSTGVGASAAIPAVGIPIALGLGVADLLFFYETSALYVLAAAELHGIEVKDAQRARPLVFGMLLGKKSQNKVSKIVLQASGAGSVDTARKVALGTVGKALPKGWGEVLTQQLPDSALAPLATVLARQALKAGGKVGARTLGKVLPFGVGAVLGGVGSFTFGRDVVKAAHIAFPTPPTHFPDSLLDFSKPEVGTIGADGQIVEPSRAMKALQAAADHVPDKKQALGVVKRVGSVAKEVGVTGAGVIKDTASDGADAVKDAVGKARNKRKG